MNFLEQLNQAMGVDPPDVRKRLVIGSSAIVIVTVSDILVLLSWAGILGIINLFGIAFVPIENIDKIAQFIIAMSGLFVVSVVYYMILPTKKEEQKKPIEGQYIWTLKD